MRYRRVNFLFKMVRIKLIKERHNFSFQQRLLDSLNSNEVGGSIILRSAELKLETRYKIFRFVRINTVHGNKIALELNDTDDNQTKVYYLLPSYAGKVESSGLEPDSMTCSDLYLEFYGFNGEGPKRCPKLGFICDGCAQLP